MAESTLTLWQETALKVSVIAGGKIQCSEPCLKLAERSNLKHLKPRTKYLATILMSSTRSWKRAGSVWKS